MNATSLINILRTQYLDDNTPDYLWSDKELVDYINQAQDWLCEEALVIQDKSTTLDSKDDEVCVYSLNGVTVPVGDIDINEKVIAIKKARLSTLKVNLELDTTVEDLDEIYSEWDDDEGDPTDLIYKMYDTGKARLYPKLDTADTLTLTVYRYPLRYVSLPEVKTSATTLTFTGSTKKISRTSGNFVTDGFTENSIITTNATLNPGPFVINTVSPTEIVVYETVTNEGPVTKTITTTQEKDLEVPAKYHLRLINKILSLAYSKQDAETEDMGKSQKHYQLALLDLDKVKRDKIRYETREEVAFPLQGNL